MLVVQSNVDKNVAASLMRAVRAVSDVRLHLELQQLVDDEVLVELQLREVCLRELHDVLFGNLCTRPGHEILRYEGLHIEQRLAAMNTVRSHSHGAVIIDRCVMSNQMKHGEAVFERDTIGLELDLLEHMHSVDQRVVVNKLVLMQAILDTTRYAGVVFVEQEVPMSFAFTFMLNEPLAYRQVQEISPSQMVFRMLAFFGALFNSEANRKRTQGEITLKTRLAVFMLSKESSGRSV